jgi:hypothetical protein
VWNFVQTEADTISLVVLTMSFTRSLLCQSANS